MDEAAASAVLHREIVCPFCALACDDLTVEAESSRLRVMEHGCPRSAEAFARPFGNTVPQLAGQASSLEEATRHAAELLAASRLPLFAGLGTDTDGMRAVLRLAERTGGVVDHAGAPGLFANLMAMQSGGWITATLAEVRNRMDLLLLVGTDAVGLMPRFFERCVWPRQALLEEVLARRQVVYLGDAEHLEGAVAPDGRGAEIVGCAKHQLCEVVGALRALIAGRKLQAEEVGGVAIERLSELAEHLKGARYAVIAWAAGELPGPHADLLVASIAELIRALNATTRCVGLPLAGADNVIGANQVCGWQSGVALRTSFATGAPDYDPHLHGTSRLLERGEADLLIWIASFRHLPPPGTDLPTVVLGGASGAPGRPVEVLIPVGTPGLDHAGSVYRTDSVVAMPLRKLRETGLSSVAEVVGLIEQQLPGQG
jgi:formylmethanofuran dehydrogenase subunit B